MKNYDQLSAELVAIVQKLGWPSVVFGNFLETSYGFREPCRLTIDQLRETVATLEEIEGVFTGIAMPRPEDNCPVVLTSDTASLFRLSSALAQLIYLSGDKLSPQSRAIVEAFHSQVIAAVSAVSKPYSALYASLFLSLKREGGSGERN